MRQGIPEGHVLVVVILAEITVTIVATPAAAAAATAASASAAGRQSTAGATSRRATQPRGRAPRSSAAPHVRAAQKACHSAMIQVQAVLVGSAQGIQCSGGPERAPRERPR